MPTFWLTLLTSPARADLTPGALTELERSWDVRDARWLSRGTALEAVLPAVPDDLDEAWQLWQDRGVDLVVQPPGPRRKQVLLADMDSTMINEECIDELARRGGIGEEVADITARAMAGELDFAQALYARVALLRDLPSGLVQTVLREEITLAPGGRVLVATMRAHGARTALVSGGFTQFTSVIAERLGFDEHRANILVEEEDRLHGTVVEPVVSAEAKVNALREITAALGLGPQDVAAVGDGANDLGMLKLAGLGIALHASPRVASQVDIQVNHGDLTAVLFLQGYSASEFAHP